MTTKLGRFAVSASLFASLLALPCVCSAAVVDEPSICNIISELAYEQAVSIGDGLPDGAYEAAQGYCEWSESYGDSVTDLAVLGRVSGSTNALIAADHAAKVAESHLALEGAE